MVTIMTKEEQECYSELLNSIKLSVKIDSNSKISSALEKLEQFVIIMNIKETKAVPLEEFEIL